MVRSSPLSEAAATLANSSCRTEMLRICSFDTRLGRRKL